MSSKAANRLIDLEREVLRVREHGGSSEDEGDRLLEMMDSLWPQLTDSEREDANMRAAMSSVRMLGGQVNDDDDSTPK